MDIVINCAMCSRPFVAHTKTAHFCPVCREYRRANSKKLLRAERAAREAAKKGQPQQLDKALAEIKVDGMTYAEAQKARTLAALGRIVI